MQINISRKKALTNKIKSEALRLGFSACGIAEAVVIDSEKYKFKNWIESGYNGEMMYMENHFDMRFNPRLLVNDAKTVISLAYNYYSLQKQVAGAPVISKYAYGEDYHKIIKEKLGQLLLFVQQQHEGAEGRGFVDSAPVHEKTWAQKSGIGWQGKNSNIIITKKGSFHFLAELIINIELEYDKPISEKCGTCTRCIDSCPTKAIVKPYVIDSNKCISYLTIELKNEIPEKMRGKLNNSIYGCDICQDVCPWNIRFAEENNEQRFKPPDELLYKSKDEWKNLNEDEFKKLFGKSAVKRTKYAGLKRNIEEAGSE